MNEPSDHERRLATAERRISEMETLMQGKLSDGIVGGGIIHVLQRVVETLYGPKENPGGIVADMTQIKKLLQRGIGVLIALEVVSKVFLFFHSK